MDFLIVAVKVGFFVSLGLFVLSLWVWRDYLFSPWKVANDRPEVALCVRASLAMFLFCLFMLAGIGGLSTP